MIKPTYPNLHLQKSFNSHNNIQKVKSEKGNKKKINNCDMPYPQKNIPNPIQQTKISRSHADLLQIPVPKFPQLITELYLSHNLIQCVSGKLRCFRSLKNLNLSYNKLTDPHQLTYQLEGIFLHRLNIRMNNFDYGYQDRLIQQIPTLQNLQQYSLGNAENKKFIFQKAQKISRAFILSFIIINKTITILLQNTFFLTQRDRNKLQNLIGVLSKHLRKTAKTYLPENPIVLLKEIQSILSLFLTIQQVNAEFCSISNLVSEIQNVFILLTQQILLKFSIRHNFTLFQSLLGLMGNSKAKFEQLNKQQILSLINVFGEKYGGRRYEIGNQSQGRYLEKINIEEEVQSHPMMKYANYKIPQKNTLIPSLPTKMSIINEKSSSKRNQTLFENLPIIVYERNYLQIVHQICLQKILQFIQVYDNYSRPLKNTKTMRQLDNQVQYLSNDDSLEIETQIHNNKENNNENKSQRDENRKTIPKGNSYILIQQNQEQSSEDKEKQKKKEKEKKVSNNARRKQRKSKIKLNLNKYSMYEISLAFKVLLALKKNKSKMSD